MALTVSHQQVADLPPANAETVSASLLAQPLSVTPGMRSGRSADCGPAALPVGSATFNDCGARPRADGPLLALTAGGIKSSAGTQSCPQSPFIHPALAAIYGGVLGLLVSLYLIWLFAEA